MKRLCLPWMIAASTMWSCASGPTPTAGPRLMPPANLTAPCELPPPPADGRLRPELKRNHLLAMALFHECRQKHRRLVQWLERTADE